VINCHDPVLVNSFQYFAATLFANGKFIVFVALNDVVDVCTWLVKLLGVFEE
jgi:hypothetical protein